MLRASSLGLNLLPPSTIPANSRICYLLRRAKTTLTVTRHGSLFARRLAFDKLPGGNDVPPAKREPQAKEPCSQNWSTLHVQLPRKSVQNKGTILPPSGFDLPPNRGEQAIAPSRPPRNHRDFQLPPPSLPAKKAPKSAKQRKVIHTKKRTAKRLISPVDPLTQETSYPAGQPWRSIAIRSLRQPGERGNVIPSVFQEGDLNSSLLKDARTTASKPSDGIIRQVVLRRTLLRTLAVTSSASQAWEAYSALLISERTDGVPDEELYIPFSHRHRLCRVLARNRPKTRTQFLRLLSVLSEIRKVGGQIHLHEWNALIDHAGKGWKRTRPEDFKTALSIFNDMVSGKPPGTTLAERDRSEEIELPQGEPVQPDIHTYTTLVSLAARTSDGYAFRHATSLLVASGLAPNRITHLSFLTYYTLTNRMSGIRSVLVKMQEQGFDLGLDGINSCLWAYSRNGRADVVMMVYRLLRHNITPETPTGNDGVEMVARQLKEEENIVVSPDIKPNEVTFTTVIQAMAHHGNLKATLSVFMDMVSSQNLEKGAPLIHEDRKLLPSLYSPTIAVYRAIFLGFARHGIAPGRPLVSRSRAFDTSEQLAWSSEHLRLLYDMFLILPESTAITRSIVWWIMVAFAKTSGDDLPLLREVWMDLQSRFGIHPGGPRNRLQKLKSRLFFEQSVS